MSTFNSDKEYLWKTLKQIEEGVIQLPAFQRGWIWPDDHIQKIIASSLSTLSLRYRTSTSQ